MIEVLIDNRAGGVFDVSNVVDSFSISQQRVGSPSSVDIVILNDGDYSPLSFDIQNGYVVRVKTQEHNIFYGYIFSIANNGESIRIKCYDQIRYLTNKDTYKFIGQTLGDIIRKIAADYQLKTGFIADTGYRIPSMLEDGQPLIDIIEKANGITTQNTPDIYVFYDDFGKLSLRRSQDFGVDFYIGEGSLLTSYDYTTEIDNDTYNVVKLYKDNKESGRREVYQAQDSANIARWGLLQRYESVNENLNDSQIRSMLDNLIRFYNRERRKLKLSECIGDFSVRAGMYLTVYIKELDIISQFLVETVKHNVSGEEHTMSLELKVI